MAQNWFQRRNIYEKKSICEVFGKTLKYYSFWSTRHRRPFKETAEKLVKWAESNTPHDIPTLDELMAKEDVA